MQMVPGKAFLVGDNSTAFPVSKQWIQVAGRQILVEELPTAIMGADTADSSGFVEGVS
jgi:hypothetical protein